MRGTAIHLRGKINQTNLQMWAYANTSTVQALGIRQPEKDGRIMTTSLLLRTADTNRNVAPMRKTSRTERDVCEVARSGQDGPFQHSTTYPRSPKKFTHNVHVVFEGKCNLTPRISLTRNPTAIKRSYPWVSHPLLVWASTAGCPIYDLQVARPDLIITNHVEVTDPAHKDYRNLTRAYRRGDFAAPRPCNCFGLL